MYYFTDDGKTTLYRQLYNALRESIISGEQKAGTKLPSKRAMAAQTGVSVNTVDSAYAQLVSEGYVSVRPRSGYTVCTIDPVQCIRLTKTALPELQAEQPQFAVDFDPSRPAVDCFPQSVWQRLCTQVGASADWLSSRPRQGDLSLRQAVAAYLASSRDVHTKAENVIIGSGTQSLLTMLALLLDNRYTFAFEDPVYHRCAELFSRVGHTTLPVEVDKQGVCIEPIRSLFPALLYTTPSHQFPLGICMPMQRRVKLLNWCAEAEDRYLIEDDYDSELRYDARPVPSLFSADRNDRVIYLGTFSSTVSSSLRVGYMVLPERLLSLYLESPLPLSCNVPVSEQIVLTRFLVEGYFEKHLNRLRTYYRKQRGFLLEQLQCFKAMAEPIGEAAGSHLTIKVKNGMNETELLQSAADEGVKVYPISPYFSGTMPQKYVGKVLLGFGGLSREEIQEGVAGLFRAWSKR